ncbi:phospholipase D family protein [Propionibacteriaceae bacterium Y2011]
MLAPDARSVLLDQLRAPLGYQLDAAVATTFVLDLTAALVPPLAFASHKRGIAGDPMAALEAVRSTADRIDVFCQLGHIQVPTAAADLMAFLEPMLHEVSVRRPGHLFHPKLWFMRYVRTDDPSDTSHRLLVLTRNLTHDHSWDISLCLDGQRASGRKASNRPLADLIRALPGMSRTPLPADRQARIEGLSEDVRRIEWELPEDVSEMAFHTFGITNSSGPDFSGRRHLVVSPFVTDDGLAHVTVGSSDVSVVSRIEAMDRLSPAAVEPARTYQLSGLAGLTRDDEVAPTAHDRPAPNQHSHLSGLHAKLYVVERNRRAHMFIGSANATGPAFGGNVEILVELIGRQSKLGVETLVGPDAPFLTMLEEYPAEGGVIPSPEEDAERDLERVLRALATMTHTVTVAPGGAPHTVTIRTDGKPPLPTGFTATVELLTLAGRAHHVRDASQCLVATLSNVEPADVTPFVVWRVKSPDLPQPLGTVVRARLVNDPKGRLDEVLARQVNTPEKFFQFLALLLSIDDSSVQAPFVDVGGGSSFGGAGSGALEMVLRAMAERPSAVDDLDQLVSKLARTPNGRAVMGEDFLDFWSVIEQARGRQRSGGVRP